MIKQHYQSIIVQTICSLLIPFIQLFALYVIFHGHYGPGGGFQGGVLLAVSIILQRLYLGIKISHQKFSPRLAMAFAAVGLLIYGLAGIIPMIFGGSFLDYGNLPLFWVHDAERRALGILIVEIGIGLGVFGTLVLIFDNLVGERW
ncbi:MAG: Na(+)/H(+) antiporter subunit B [Chloroflexi bacterium]|nr:Na(+)/H(+) antiporter subunit B [Chloroflexota bacterium]